MADIFEKKLLLLGKPKKKYKAYLLYGATAVDVATLGFTEPIDLDTTKGTSFDCYSCNYVILNGKLYYCPDQYTLTRVGTLTDWTDITGYANVNGSTYAYGIAGGKLYKIYNNSGITTTQVGTATDWTNVSGYYGSSIYPYGISGGKLYYINNTTTTQVGSATTWTYINGFYRSNYYAYGFNSDILYRISGTSASAVDSLSRTKISGYSYSNSTFSIYAYGIADGKLYYLYSTTKGQIGSATNWTDISGYSYRTSTSASGLKGFAIGISGGKLYSIGGTDSKTTKQIGSLTDWTKVSGTVYYTSSSSSFTAYGIRNGNIYRLYWGGTSSNPAVAAADLSIPNCVEIYGSYYYGGSSTYTPALAICEQ